MRRASTAQAQVGPLSYAKLCRYIVTPWHLPYLPHRGLAYELEVLRLQIAALAQSLAGVTRSPKWTFLAQVSPLSLPLSLSLSLALKKSVA